jgi:hypothetical protein
MNARSADVDHSALLERLFELAACLFDDMAGELDAQGLTRQLRIPVVMPTANRARTSPRVLPLTGLFVGIEESDGEAGWEKEFSRKTGLSPELELTPPALATQLFREKVKPEFQKDYNVNPTYLIFVARAVVDTLKDPWINGEIRGDKIVTRNYVNLGFAVELADGKGLIVPVVKNAEGLNLLGMARAVTDVAERARNKQLTPDEVQGGTFTITNPGGYGTFHGTPVISQPQAAILGTYAVVKRPWVVQDEMGQDVIAIRPIMNLTLTYDHRLVDGALAGRFLRDLREKLETWDESSY